MDRGGYSTASNEPFSVLLIPDHTVDSKTYPTLYQLSIILKNVILALENVIAPGPYVLRPIHLQIG